MAIPPILPMRGGVVARPDMSDDPDIFPYLRGQSPPKKGIEWNTTVLKSKSGRKFSRQNWTYPVRTFSISFASLAQKPMRMDLDRIAAFFNRRAGQFGNFYYFDPTDNQVVSQTLGVGDGVTTEFELRRTFGTWNEPILALNGPPEVTVNGLPVTNFSFPAPGVLTFGAAPAAGAIVAWSGSFFFFCQLTQDNFDAQKLNRLLWSSDGLTFETVKL